MNKLSHTQVKMYTECAKRYYFNYVKRVRPTTLGGALLFGSALDQALNELLVSRDLNEATKIFEKSLRFQRINGIETYIPTSESLVYSDKDFDPDLLDQEDINKWAEHQYKLDYQTNAVITTVVWDIKKLKSAKGFLNLTSEQRSLYNYANWLSLRQKGLVILKGYHDKILPEIVTVQSVQQPIEIVNADGDSIGGFIDFVATMKDGKSYVMDNKTSSIAYAPDSAMRSQQLILYYHAVKEQHKADGVGFIVLYKNLEKNKTKTCKVCKADWSGTRFETCNNKESGTRCDGELEVATKPELRYEIILNEVTEAAEDLVIQTFDEANVGIKKGVFNPNLSACQTGFKCTYYDLCWRGSMDGLAQLDPNQSTKPEVKP